MKLSEKTERCISYAIFKDMKGTLKEPAWKHIEPQALELGYTSLYCKVQEENLFTRETQFHQSYSKSSNAKYVNHQCHKAANPAIDTDQVCKAAAHLKAFAAFLCFINP